MQLDLGKDTDAGFERTGSLNRPPDVLLKAAAHLIAKHTLGGSTDMSTYISAALDRFPNYKAKHPGSEKDRLFEATYDHHAGRENCQLPDTTRVLYRHPRDTEDPVIHYGLIGSSNSVIKSSRTRDFLKGENILCVDMEAAGVMNNLPCLVIRRICDYCDSNKNDDWQPYAALAAAAYAKELLGAISGLGVEAAPTALQILRESKSNLPD